MPTAKQSARELLDRLPDSVGWDDIQYELYVRQKIDEGLAQLDAGGGVSHDEAKRRLLGKA